ncbi:MAG: ferritin-like protein [Cyclobacteriaceae bacterium]
MLKLQQQYLDKINAATKPEDLHGILQGAIELEHSTVPPYLTAMFSLKPGRNREIWSVIHSVVLEEMLHMTIACNILIALGGNPDFIHKEFVPDYPGPLPMNVACEDPADEKCLQVSLGGFSKSQVQNVFMAIEQPEIPLEFEVKEGRPELLMGAAGIEEEKTSYATIGAFYAAIIKKLKEMGLDRLPGADRPQVIPDKYYPKEDCFRICTTDDAIRAIDVIVEQGEGTNEGVEGGSPLDPDGELAHYYRFAEIYFGKRLVKDPDAPGGYSYSGPVFPFEVDGLWNLEPNTKTASLPPGSPQRRQADQFNFVYRKLLLTLHQAFNGEPEKFDATLGLMFDLKLVGEKLVSMPYPNKVGINCGPPFEYTTLNS